MKKKKKDQKYGFWGDADKPPSTGHGIFSLCRVGPVSGFVTKDIFFPESFLPYVSG